MSKSCCGHVDPYDTTKDTGKAVLIYGPKGSLVIWEIFGDLNHLHEAGRYFVYNNKNLNVLDNSLCVNLIYIYFFPGVLA